MKSRQFPSYKEAKQYLQERGKVEFHGKDGHYHEYDVFTIEIGNKIYTVTIYQDGLMKIIDERYK